MPSPNVAQRSLYDIRDENVYTVRKLADGNCWMVSNLALKLEADKIYENYGSYNDGSTFDLSTGATCANNGACVMNGNTVYDNSVGQGYYSWYAATAGRGISTSTGDIDGSICPKGWKLPYNYSVNIAKSYAGLLSSYGMPVTTVNKNYIDTFEAVPFSFSRAGLYQSGNHVIAGTESDHWSSTTDGATTDRARSFVYNASYTYPQGSNYKYQGFLIRCVNI